MPGVDDPRAAALLASIDRDRQHRCLEALEEGDRRARQALEAAAREARRRTRASLQESRIRETGRIDAAAAELATQRRRLDDEVAVTLLLAARGRIRQGLLRRWQTPEGRAGGRRGAAEAAGRSLLPGAWTVQHPPSCPAHALDELRSDLAARGGEPVGFEAAADIEAGIRLLAGAATLDATLEGLLASPAAIEGRLLAECSRAADPGAAP